MEREMEHEKQYRHPSDPEIRGALERIIASHVFANSARLQDFLTYIVEEQISGRGSTIKGKTVAVAVYDREIDEAGSAQNLVRVEARRLRRALEEFYATDGQSEDLRITVKPGSYTPSFEYVSPEVEGSEITEPKVAELALGASEQPRSVSRWVKGAAIALLAVVAVAASASVFWDRLVASQGPSTDAISPELAALSERSVASVQSFNIAQQARGMFFPIFDATRQGIALDSFRHAISLDPDLPMGYAGAAQVLALQSFLSPDTATSDSFIQQAQNMAARSLELGPTDGWAQASQAWTLAVVGDVDRAIRHARIALELSPEDGHVLDLIGLTALVSGDAVLLAKASDPARSRSGVGRFGANNLWGTSQLMLENYPATIEAFSNAAKRGLPVSAPSLLLLAAAYDASGEEAMARDCIVTMTKTWPKFRAELVASRFFSRDPETLKKVLLTYRAYADQG